MRNIRALVEWTADSYNLNYPNSRLPKTFCFLPCPSMHALKLLRCHGLNRSSYKAVVFAKLLHASPAWWGFATVADKQRIEAFLRRGVRLNLYSADDPRLSQCVADADE